MSDQFVAEIRIFPFAFAPKGWALCNGQLLPISQNTALFSLLGTTYGGDGKSTFALPDLQGRAGMAPGQGPGLSMHDLGEEGGVNQMTLVAEEMPVHTHALRAHAQDAGDLNAPSPARSLARSNGGNVYGPVDGAVKPMAGLALSVVGGSLPHNNVQPMLVMSYCIAMQGIFPSRP
jgi:microcystin-dependent protein